jgi:hypothetical protein
VPFYVLSPLKGGDHLNGENKELLKTFTEAGKRRKGGFIMERYENGFRMSERQEDAFGQAFYMVSLVSEALKRKCETVEPDSNTFIDGINIVMQEVEKRLLFAKLEDAEEFKARQSA